MRIMKILFIDDGDIEQIVSRIIQKMKREGVDVVPEIINPQDAKYKIEKDGDYVIDFDKLKKDILDNFSSTKFHVIACDFNFANDDINGYEVIRWIINTSKSKNFAFKNAKFVCYSSEENKFCEHIIENEELIKLIKLNIHAFYKRTSLSQELSALLKKISNEFSLSEHFKQLLETEPDRTFKNMYPKFADKTLRDIAAEIEKESHHGQEFQRYLAELTFAHILELNE